MLSQTRIVIDSVCAQEFTGLLRQVERDAPRGLKTTCLDLSRAVRSATALTGVAVVIVGPRTSEGAPSEEIVRSIRTAYPQMTIYVCCQAADRVWHRVKEYAEAGVDEVFTLSLQGALGDLLSVLTGRLLAPVPEVPIRRFINATSPGLGVTIALWCLRNGYRTSRVGDVARLFGRHRSSIGHLLQRSGLPTADELLRVGCLLHARELQHLGVRPQEEIARRVGRGSAGSLREVRHRLMRNTAMGVWMGKAFFLSDG